MPIPLKQHRQYAVSDPESAEDILKLAGVQGYADVVEEDGVSGVDGVVGVDGENPVDPLELVNPVFE